MATIAALLDCGISFDYHEEPGKLALIRACENGHLEVSNCLLGGVPRYPRLATNNNFALHGLPLHLARIVDFLPPRAKRYIYLCDSERINPLLTSVMTNDCSTRVTGRPAQNKSLQCIISAGA